MASSDYLLQAVDVPPGATVPAAGAANVIPLVDGKNYFGALHSLLTGPRANPAPKQLVGCQKSAVPVSCPDAPRSVRRT
jgi:hypothetical protein